ncbi:hypothetical protein BGZ73_007248 [Actinomortierella ambigua]|nr:hypothetical protein BGZ73_007248 [Actinomortierella ambigua]
MRSGPLFTTTLSQKELVLGKFIGSGGYGSVYVARWGTRRTAVKIFNVSWDEVEFNSKIKEEIRIHKDLSDRHVIQFYGTTFHEGKLMLIMQYAEGGSLQSAIIRRVLSWPAKKRIAQQIASGLAYIHGENVIHGDLKSLNVLLDKPVNSADDDVRHVDIRLCDFGFAHVKTTSSSKSVDASVRKGTMRWMAPELFRAAPLRSTKLDIYALGMVMWEMAAECTVPFMHHNEFMVMTLVMEGTRERLPGSTPPDYRETVERCWEHDPRNRPAAVKLFADDLEFEDEHQTDDSKDVIDFLWSSSSSATPRSQSTAPQSQSASSGLQSATPRMAIPPSQSAIRQSHLVVPRSQSATRQSQVIPPSQSAIHQSQIVIPRSQSATQQSQGVIPQSQSSTPPSQSGSRTQTNGVSRTAASRPEYLNAWSAQTERPKSGKTEDRIVVEKHDDEGTDSEQSEGKEGSKSRLTAKQKNAILRGLFEWVHKSGQDIALSPEATKWSAEQGHTRAQYNLGMMYKHGQGVEQSDANAVKWLTRAAFQGDTEAERELDRMIGQGQTTYEDVVEVLNGYVQMAENGDADAQYYLGLMFKLGRRVRQSDVKAAKWFTAAADQGHAIAQLTLGLMYKDGHGVVQSDDETIKWLTKAAMQRNKKAEDELEMILRLGRGTYESNHEAYKWCILAASQDRVFAKHILGNMYEYGRGVERSDTKAIYWYTKAAEQGLADAQYRLGCAYTTGQGVMMSDVKAKEWYAKAAEQGHFAAMLALRTASQGWKN